MKQHKAVFLDRDGTIIHDRDYLAGPEDVELLPGAAAALRLLQQAGYLLVVVSNQSGVARGYFDDAAVARVQARVDEVLAGHGVTLDTFKYCPHGPDDACACRKPLPGMFLEAIEELDIDVTQCAAIGDKARDAAAGEAAGCPRNIVIGGDDRYEVAGTLLEAAQRLLDASACAGGREQ